MEALDYWRLCDELSVIQAALLIIGEDPATTQDSIDNWHGDHRPKGYDGVIAALKNGIRSKSIPATLRHDAHEQGYDETIDPEHEGMRIQHGLIAGALKRIIYTKEPNWHLTTIRVDTLKKWLVGRGFKTGFFFSNTMNTEAEFLDLNNPFYAPKLAAAYCAWDAVSSHPELTNGRTPKQALQKWLREHASKFNLTKDDGNPNETGIDDVCKIANWKPEGGASRTPTQVHKNPTTIKNSAKSI